MDHMVQFMVARSPDKNLANSLAENKNNLNYQSNILTTCIYLYLIFMLNRLILI